MHFLPFEKTVEQCGQHEQLYIDSGEESIRTMVSAWIVLHERSWCLSRSFLTT